MKILLIYNYTIVEPLGALFLVDYLERYGHNVDLVDYQSLKKTDKYDLVGFSILTGSHNQMFEIADKIRSKIKVVIGGPHAISFVDDCKKHADFVVRGFGEKLFLKIANGELPEGIYSEAEPPTDSFISQNTRDKFYQDEMRRNNVLKNVITALCCPFQCTYCYNSIVQKEFPSYKYLPRPVDTVIKECKILTNYPLKVIVFQDDTFGVDLEWLKEFKEKYKKEINVPFHCNIRIEMAVEERIKLLKEAGCISVTFAIESAGEKIRRKLLNRQMTNEQILQGIEILRKYNLPFRTQQMLGLPETSLQDDLELLKLNCQIKPVIAWTSIFSPIRGTPLGEYCVDKGYYNGKNDDIADTLFSHSVLNFSEKRKKQIVVLNKLFMVLAHLPRGWEIAESMMEADLDNWDDFYKTAKNYLYDAMYGLDSKESPKTRSRD